MTVFSTSCLQKMKEKLLIYLFSIIPAYDDTCLRQGDSPQLSVRQGYYGYIAGEIFKELPDLIRFYCPYFIVFLHKILLVQLDRLSGLKVTGKPSHKFPAGLGHLV